MNREEAFAKIRKLLQSSGRTAEVDTAQILAGEIGTGTKQLGWS